MIVNLSSIAACFGRCSQKKTPGSRVGMTPNGPRFWSGRSGLGSQVSIWLGPPAIQSRMTALFPATGRPASDARARRRSRSGRLSPAIPARPALSMLRRLATTRPSRSRGLRPAKACRVGMFGSAGITHEAAPVAGPGKR